MERKRQEQSYLYKTSVGDISIYKDPEIVKGKISPELNKLTHKDIRGVIQRFNKLNLDWLDKYGVSTPLPNLLYTKKGFMRSGDIHKNTQHDVILSGKVELWTLEKGKTIKKIIGPNTKIIINPHIPHLFNFLEDTIMLEWWDSPFETWFYTPYRKIVDDQNKKISSE